MAMDVHVRFTLAVEDEGRARGLLEALLMRFLDPTSDAYQPSPHAILDSWGLEPEPDELPPWVVLAGDLRSGYRAFGPMNESLADALTARIHGESGKRETALALPMSRRDGYVATPAP